MLGGVSQEFDEREFFVIDSLGRYIGKKDMAAIILYCFSSRCKVKSGLTGYEGY